jgi:hypothetical protein
MYTLLVELPSKGTLPSRRYVHRLDSIKEVVYHLKMYSRLYGKTMFDYAIVSDGVYIIPARQTKRRSNRSYQQNGTAIKDKTAANKSDIDKSGITCTPLR